MQRRQFLVRGLCGGAVLAAGGISLGMWQGGALLPLPEGLLALDAFAFSVVTAATPAILQRPDADAHASAIKVDAALSFAAPEAQAEFRDFTRALNSSLLGTLLDGRVTPFLALSGNARADALEHWRFSRLLVRRSGYQALKKLVCAAYYASPSTWAGVGYAGPPSIGSTP